jgi:hypothetical protein
VAAVYAAAVGGDRRDEDDAAPALVAHLLDAAFHQEEGGADVDAVRVVEFFDGDVPDVGYWCCLLVVCWGV